MTDHTVFEERICAMLDGELSDGEAAELRAHLDECPECRAFLDAMKAVYGLSAKELPEAPPELSKNVMERVLAEAGAAADHPRGRVIRFPFRSLAAAAAAALVLWAGARSLPAFRAKSAAPQADEAVEEEAVSSEPEAYGAVNGGMLFDSENPLSAPAAEAAPEEGLPASRAVPTVTVHGTALLWNGEPLTLSELEDKLSGAGDYPDGVELALEEPDPETESAVRALLGALNIPVREP